MKTLLVIALSLSAAFAQTAKVVPLSPADAAKAKQLHAAVKAAQEASNDFDQRVYATYIEKIPESILNKPESVWRFSVKHGWENGFEYSDNFLFIVPKESIGKLEALHSEYIDENPPGCKNFRVLLQHQPASKRRATVNDATPHPKENSNG